MGWKTEERDLHTHGIGKRYFLSRQAREFSFVQISYQFSGFVSAIIGAKSERCRNVSRVNSSFRDRLE
jgi:hypothetical protein